MSIYKQKFLSKRIILILPFFSFSLMISCSHKISGQAINYEFKNKTEVPNYSNLDYWAASPFKYDPSDNVPRGLKDRLKDTLADVFFIYPTSYTDKQKVDRWNADINDARINEKTDNGSILYQASVFNRYCRVFAPRYRQANLNVFYTKYKDSAEAALDLAYEDVRNAFEYYLKNYNNGRPIIIASHSQGTWMAGRLLKEFFEGKSLQKQLVCAYIIGLPVFTNYFTQLKPCADSTETGCFVSWRTFQRGYVAPYIEKETLKAYVINPLTWTMDTAFAPASLNKGGVLRNFNKVIPGLVNAQIHGNVLWVNKPKFLGSIFLKTKNFHIADYNLFYQNIRENVGTRIRAFFKKSGSK
jgi:expansin (peptidoglycan-binding protein)